MIDLHCHLLPGVDDGARTLDEALAMARESVATGVRAAALTPHLDPADRHTEIPRHQQAFQLFSTSLVQHSIPLAVRLAAEIVISPELLPMVEEGMVPAVGEQNGYRIILLEFPFTHIPPGSDKLVKWLVNQKIRPLIAHPERNQDIMRNSEKLVPFLALGCLAQVNTGSLLGAFGEGPRKSAFDLLERDWVTAIGSDAHDLSNRPPELDAARQLLVDWGGEEAAIRLTQTQPAAIFGAVAA